MAGSVWIRGVRYAKSYSIRYFIDIDILQNSLINIDIDIFKNGHIDIDIDIFQIVLINIDIDIFKTIMLILLFSLTFLLGKNQT